MKMLFILMFITISSVAIAETSECININNNKICFSTLDNKEIKFNTFNKKKYRSKIIKKSEKAIKRSKIISYTHTARVNLDDEDSLWNDTVNKSISRNNTKNQLLDFMLGFGGKTSEIPLNKIIEYINPSLFNISVSEVNKKILFSLHVNEKYIDNIWDDIKPNGKCKKQNIINYFNFLGNVDLLKYKSGSSKKPNCISPYSTKGGLLNFLNNDISKQVNNYINLFPEVNMMALNLYNYGKNRLIPKIKKIKHVESWFENNYILEELKYKRKVFLLNSFPFGDKAPWIDNGIGNLYLLKKDYEKLKERNLFGYLMMHEAEHIKMNLKSSMSNFLTGEIPRVFEAICKENKNGPIAKELCENKYEYKKIESSLELEAKEIFESSNNNDEELIIDISIISRLPIEERNYYIDMLEVLLPISRKKRIEILKEYVNFFNDFEKIDMPDIDQETLFLLLQVKEERRGMPDIVGIIWSTINPSKKDKRTSRFIKKTINIDRLSKIIKQYKKMYRSKSLYLLRDKTYNYVKGNMKSE